MLLQRKLRQVDVRFRWFIPRSQRNLPLPKYESALAAGMDVAAAVMDDVVLMPADITLISTGFGVAIPDGFELQVRSRSGLAAKHGITVVNAPGTIDADYRGEIKVGLINLSQEAFTVHRGDRIAQLILAPVCRAHLEIVDELDETERGAGGFGHTGF